MTRSRLIVALALLIIVVALLSEREPPREATNVLPFKRKAA